MHLDIKAFDSIHPDTTPVADAFADMPMVSICEIIQIFFLEGFSWHLSGLLRTSANEALSIDIGSCLVHPGYLDFRIQFHLLISCTRHSQTPAAQSGSQPSHTPADSQGPRVSVPSSHTSSPAPHFHRTQRTPHPTRGVPAYAQPLCPASSVSRSERTHRLQLRARPVQRRRLSPPRHRRRDLSHHRHYRSSAVASQRSCLRGRRGLWSWKRLRRELWLKRRVRRKLRPVEEGVCQL